MTRYRATIIAGVFVACVLALAFAVAGNSLGDSTGTSFVVRVHDADGAMHEFALDADGEYDIDSSLGHNTIRIEGGSVRMVDADCPNRSCMSQAALTRPGAQIICLPHRLWVEIGGTDGSSSQLDEDLVVWSDDASADLDTVAR